MPKSFTLYLADQEELETYQNNLKQKCCPHCRTFGTLNRHGSLKGHDTRLKRSAQKLLRGRRVYCSNRGRRKGCGKTFSILFSNILKGHLVGARTLSRFLKGIAAGQSIKSAWQQSTTHFCLETGYRLIRKFEALQSSLRTTLCQKQPPPQRAEVEVPHPLSETIDHLMNAFAESPCAVTAFQQHFQKGFLSD